MDRFAALGLSVPEILLPGPEVDLSRWAVVACDQFTSQPEYWHEAEALVGDAPSTLNLVIPEAFLDQGGQRVARVDAAMARTLQEGVLARKLNGWVLVERTTRLGPRLGLVAAVDLEQYSFEPGAQTLIRATEGTIKSRIPPRVAVRRGACLELSHVLLLVDDPEQRLIEPLYAGRDALTELYDFELMLGGGRVRGWAVERPEALLPPLTALKERAQGMLYAVGDGNHSLAAARQLWLEIRETLPRDQWAGHPARYALVEIENLHSPALEFEPIHRALFGVAGRALLEQLSAWLAGRGLALRPCGESEAGLSFVDAQGIVPLAIEGGSPLSVHQLQPFLDEALAGQPGARLDYIHGREALIALAQGPECCGFLLPAFDKRQLFEAVRRSGPLPRKTFSMGSAHEKRYYLEARRIAR